MARLLRAESIERFSLSQALSALVLVLFVVAGYWLVQRSGNEAASAPARRPTPAIEREQNLEDFHFVALRRDGSVIVAQGQRAQRRAEDEWMRLQALVAERSERDGRHLQVKAAEARLSEKREQLWLSGGAQLQIAERSGVEPLLIESASLEFSNKEARIEAPDTVTLSGRGSRLSAARLIYELGEERLELTGQVRGSFSPSLLSAAMGHEVIEHEAATTPPPSPQPMPTP